MVDLHDECISCETPQEGFPTAGTPRPAHEGSAQDLSQYPDNPIAMKAIVNENRRNAMEERNKRREMIRSVK